MCRCGLFKPQQFRPTMCQECFQPIEAHTNKSGPAQKSVISFESV